MAALPDWMKPESAAVHPTAIKNCSNGLIPADLLQPSGIRSFVLIDPAATSMRALVEAAAKDGVSVSATGTYRSFAQQEALFYARYQNTPSYPGARHEVYKGQDWWLKKGVAGAAVPGTSNHGWGLAVDFARKDKLGRVVALDGVTLSWLRQRGPSLGWYNTVASENWHWCYCLGDKLPPLPPAPPAYRTLKLGDQGPDVAKLQTILRQKGFDPGNPDGKFGPRTDAALRAFQKANGLTVDGVCGPATWKALSA